MIKLLKTTRVIKSIVADVVNYPVNRLTLEGDLFIEYGLDSLGIIAIMVELQDAFGVPEPETSEQFRELNTIRNLVCYVMSQTD